MYMRCNCFSHQAFGLVTFSLPLPSWFALRSLFTRGRNLSKFLRETRGWSVVRVWTRGIRVRGREKIKKSERVCQKRRKAKFDGWRFGDKKSDAPDNQLVVSPFSCSSLLCHFSLDSAWENPTIFLFSFHVKIKYVRLNAVNYIGRAKSHPWLPQRTLWFHRLQSVFCTFQAQSESLVEFHNVVFRSHKNYLWNWRIILFFFQFPIFQMHSVRPRKSCINYCCEMLFGICRAPKNIWN